MKAPGIYQILHVSSGRIYVGSAVNIAKRWRTHKAELNRGTHYNTRLQAAWTRFGASALKFCVLELLDDSADILTELIPAEQAWIDGLNATNYRFGFNACRMAGSSLGYKHTPESRAKMSMAQTGRKHSPETLQKIRAAQKGLAKENRERLIAYNKGRVFSAETRAKIAASNAKYVDSLIALGKRNKGRVHSAEARAKMSAANKGRKLSQAQIDGMRIRATGRTHTEDARAKMSLAAKTRSPETRARMRLARLAYNARTRAILPENRPVSPEQLTLSLDDTTAAQRDNQHDRSAPGVAMGSDASR